MNATLLFWILFVVLNSYYFLPRYFLEIFHSEFFPWKCFTHGSVGERLRAILIRRNYDIFRISTDFFLLTLAYPFILRDTVGVTTYTIILSIYFGLSLLYQIYYHAFHRIYHLDPVFFHDFLMLKTAGQIFIHEYTLRNFIITCFGVVLGATGILLIHLMLTLGASTQFGTGSHILIITFLAGAAYSLWHYPYAKYPMLTFQCQLQSFIRNLLISGKSKRSLAHLTLKYMKTYNVDPASTLLEKPNVYFFVIESYGRIAFQDDGLRSHLDEYLPVLEDQLKDAGYSVASTFTKSPVTGGASWISYTSMMYGLNVRNQGVYLTMLKNKYMDQYDSLFHWLKRQGYSTFRISSLGGYEKMDIPYDSYSRLYGIDHWIKYKDLEFTGMHYGFGPSPPDQFAVWKGDTTAARLAGDSPRAVFFISQNSHTPYDSPEEVSEQWEALNTAGDVAKKPSAFWTRPKFEKYGAAIEYQLRYMVDFIIKHASSQDIFVLVGDHQPPSLSITLDNFETPLHVISRRSDFVASWAEYGLVPGLMPEAGTAIKQEAVHSALLRGMIRTFGSGALPEFQPNGITY